MIKGTKNSTYCARLVRIMIFGAAMVWHPFSLLDAQQSSTVSNTEAFHRIVADIQARRYAEALAQSNIALRTSPQDYRIWTLRGMAYSGLENVSSALSSFEGALKIAPSYLPALESAAQLKYNQGDDSARPFLLRVLAQRPDDPTTHAMLGVLDYKKSDCSAAVSHFQQAGESIAAQPAALADYGRCLAILKRFQEAIPIFSQSLVLDSSQPSTRYDLALCQWNANRTQEALSTLQPLLETDQIDERVLLLAAAIYESANETQRAIDLLRKGILSNPKNAEAYLQFAYLSYEHGSPKISIDLLNTGLTQLPGDARLYLVRGVMYCQLGEFTKAMDDFQTANHLDPKLSFVDVAMGIVESQAHKSAESIAQFRAAAKKHPDQAFTQYLLAEALAQQEKSSLPEAIAAASRAVRLDPKLVSAQDLLAGIYLQEGRKQLAIEHSEAALAADPRDQQALYHLILALRNTERKGEIPALMKRMNELREEKNSLDAPKKRVHQLYETPEAK